jgi:pteridine reductase
MMEHSKPAPLGGRSVLITGAARRIGAAIARLLHAQGANVTIHCRRSGTTARELASVLNGIRPGSAIVTEADLLDCDSYAPLIESATLAFGRLDILVNNASSFYPTPIGEITLAQWDDLMGTNLRAPLFLSQAATQQLRLHEGLIVNIIDIHASTPLKRHPVYCAAKAGLAMLTRSLARELGPQIRVNGVAPGPVLWPEGDMPAALQDDIVSRTALKRLGTPDDVAKAVLYLARDAPYVTGQILAIDGGRSLGGR